MKNYKTILYSCPKCDDKKNQINSGKTTAGSQRIKCKVCGNRYTPDPKKHIYPEHIRLLAIKDYYDGNSGRGIGKIYGFSHQNVGRWIEEVKELANEKHED